MYARLRHSAIWIVVCALMVLAGPAARAEPSSASPTLAQEQEDSASLAIRKPEEYAWRLFAAIDESANNGTNDVIWETWANQNEVYTNDSSHTPVWPAAHRPKLLGPSLQHAAAGLAQGGPGRAQPNDSAPPGADDVHLNRATFDYVVEHQLWFMQGVTTFVQNAKVQLPRDSVAIKARWLVISPSDEPRYHWQTYHDPKRNIDEIVGLVGLHVASKALPNWAWATFEHVDNPGRCDFIGCHDVFGQIPANVAPNPNKDNTIYPPEQLTPSVLDVLNAAGLGPEWHNYRLKGAQVDFTTTTGQPILLGNSVTEANFVPTSSCMTCHARATVDAQGGSLQVFQSNSPLAGSVGTPDPSWFPSDSLGTPLFYQTDFLWELPFITKIAEQNSQAAGQ